LDELNAKSESPDFWNDPTQAQALMRERTRLDDSILSYFALENEFNDTVAMIELADAEGDEALVAESENGLETLKVRAAAIELEFMLSGEADPNDAYLEVHAGAGGTESQDWASMLLRMYMRWAERKGYRIDYLEQSEGEEAGIKSATICVKGHNAYGWLKTEGGVHRLVRISPFDSNARRHTSFASVGVYPVIDDKIDIDIPEKEVRIDLYRASGAGGQHVNKTESAVRITHLPSGIVVQCQNDRSQHKNRATAWEMLRARMYEAELKRREDAAQAVADAKSDIGWGHQIRSYVLQPYQMVKDLRTGVESHAPQDVLDGDLDSFMAASLAQKVGGKTSDEVSDLE
jgi:peptide chain release factor 2